MMNMDDDESATASLVVLEEEEAVPTEEAVNALLDCLVDPLLPRKASQLIDPSNIPLQQSIAKQMHAVVLVYNYYHRKQFPELEFLDYKSFCEFAVKAKPSMKAFFQDMENCNGDENENLSITEKAIMKACKISLELEAAPSMEMWPTAKVAVFLMDSRQENCSLYFGDTTEGVWSLIEKSDAETGDNSFFRAKKRPVGRILISDENRLRQLAISAVKEKTGLDQINLVILESHVTYSLSQEKTTARLFIMKCKSVKEDLFEFPIKDAIDSLQGPLVKKSSFGCEAVDTVMYFHLFPYAEILTDWFSRKVSGNGSVHNKRENITKIFSPRSAKRMTISPTEKGEGSPISCPNSYLLVPKTSCSEKVNQKDNDNYDLSRNQNIGEIKSSKGGRNSSTVLVDDTESDIRSTKSDSAVKKTTEKIVESIGTLKTAGLPVFKAKSAENLDAKENGEDHMSRCHNIDEDKSQNFCGPIEKRKTDPQIDNDTNSGSVVKDTQEKIEGSSGTCQTADFHVLETKTTENLDAKENDNYHVSNIHDIDEVISSRFPPRVFVDHAVTASGLITAHCSSAVKEGVVDPTRRACDRKSIDVNIVGRNDICSTGFPCQDSALKRDLYLVPPKSGSQDYGKIQAMLTSKADELSRASLKALSMKQNELCHQQRHLEDEIAQCEKKIQTILSGGEDDFLLKIESILEACNVTCGRGATGTQEEHAPRGIKRKRLSEAILSLQSPCQELDAICSENNWILPRYTVVSSTGGFQSNVIVRGIEFECSDAGEVRGNATEARESAAARLLSKLRTMASEAQ
ncbi:hypothetical protein FRX31_020398 [Thalictrum thalictroides]|uniref:DRBM domain-containing protein n=1 Tax=Thalictrum thalictroides TaxID=46969 RepID=A0A7J6VY08_THATH|nr:hypothetical protein FRX31_020398 [Thalictrum thalictroides]